MWVGLFVMINCNAVSIFLKLFLWIIVQTSKFIVCGMSLTFFAGDSNAFYVILLF